MYSYIVKLIKSILVYRGVVILITLHITPLILYFYTSLFLWLRQQKENKKEGVIKIGIRRYHGVANLENCFQLC
jgi:hypothetical protein